MSIIKQITSSKRCLAFALLALTLYTPAAIADAVPVGNDTLDLVSVIYDHPAPGQSTWFYTVVSGTAPSISHVTFQLNLDCATVVETGTWDGSDPESSALSSGPHELGTDPTTGVTGLKFDEGYEDGETRHIYFTVDNNYEVSGILVASKGGNGFDTATIWGPSLDCTVDTGDGSDPDDGGDPDNDPDNGGGPDDDPDNGGDPDDDPDNGGDPDDDPDNGGDPDDGPDNGEDCTGSAVKATLGDVTVGEYAVIDSYSSCDCVYAGVYGSDGAVEAAGSVNVDENASVNGDLFEGAASDPTPTMVPDGISLQGNLEVRSGETLVLEEGDYYFDSIFIKDNSRIETTGTVNVWFRGRLEIGGNAPIVAADNSPANLTFNSTHDSQLVEVKSNAFMIGVLNAPNVPDIRINSNAEIFGMVIGASVIVQPNAVIHRDMALCEGCVPAGLLTDPFPAVLNALEATSGNASVGQFALVDSYNSCNGSYGGDNVEANGSVQALFDVPLHPDAIVHGGIQPNTDSTQQSVPVPDGLVNMGTLFINSNESVTLPEGDYLFEDVFLNSNATLLTEGLVRIWFTGRLEIGSNAHANALSGNPSDLWFFGGCGAGDVMINESSSGINLIGVVHAPELPALIMSNSHVYGAIVGSDIEVRPNANVHYDEALAGGECDGGA